MNTHIPKNKNGCKLSVSYYYYLTLKIKVYIYLFFVRVRVSDGIVEGFKGTVHSKLKRRL